MLNEESSGAPEEPLPGDGPPAAVETEPLETVAVSEERTEQAGAAGQLLEACPACGTLMDVTEQAPFAEIHCPSCGQKLRARKQFNNYKLIELLGEGGMGSVFKATDCNLNRHVALKILKKEISTNPEERAKLAVEARVTASVNHPHVVKVFSFGNDHGQFYLAMELVEKGTLDQLMAIQRRVAEIQILDVGIQIAQGLQAALELNLIHRDIKPGNILFADAHTAKLVDFGLAIVMDEAAQARGEIWGTPYYIAPEKLDNQPEDFRSDIYSLGGTLFHALAGRPPYEAETASMVALKQLKSQPVSLQAFAPEVSSETAYVVNRMLAKNPDDRYPSYADLIEHLSYARHKIVERTQKPHRPKERVVLETQTSKKISAFLSLGILAIILLTGLFLFLFRDSIFHRVNGDAAQVQFRDTGEVDAKFRAAVKLAAGRNFEDARTEFNRLANLPGIPQPQKNWNRLNEGLATFLAGDRAVAAGIFDSIDRAGPYADESAGERSMQLADFFVNTSRRLADTDTIISPSIVKMYKTTNEEAFALLAFALLNWDNGAVLEAGPIFEAFHSAKPEAPVEWINEYQPLADGYLNDYQLIKDINDGLSNATDPKKASALLVQLQEARGKLRTGSRAGERLDALEKKLRDRGGR